jgi:WD40 repeat protein
VSIRDLVTDREVCTIEECNRAITRLRFTTNGSLCILTHANFALVVTFAANKQTFQVRELQGHADGVNDIRPLPSSTKCITCSDDETVKVWDITTGDCTHTLHQHTEAVIALALHPSLRQFASGSADHTVCLWSIEPYDIIRRFKFSRAVQSLAFINPTTLCVGVFDSGVLLCDVRTGEVGGVLVEVFRDVRSITVGMVFCDVESHALISCSM